MKIALVSLTLFVSICPFSSCQTADLLPSRGTINIFLGDKAHGVLVTDSRGTFSDGKYEDSEKKLFKVDDQTALSIAGLVFDPGPKISADTRNSFPLSVSAASMISAFLDEISKKKAPVTYETKVDDLCVMIQYLLDNLNAEQIAAVGVKHPVPIELEIIIAGYDSKGILRGTKRALSYAEARGNSARPNGVLSSFEPKLSDGLHYLVSGPQKATDEVEARIKNPDLLRFEGQTEVRVYRRAKQNHHANRLTTRQLSQFATYLKAIAEKNGMLGGFPNSVIGGPKQEALFENGKVTIVSAPDLKSYPELFARNIILNSNLNGSLMPMSFPSAIYVDANCIGDGTTLGGKMLLRHTAVLSGRLTDCTFFFDGDPFYINTSVQVTRGTLVIGPHLCDQSSALAKAREQLPGIKEIWWSNYPVDSQLQLLLWRGGQSRCGPGDIVNKAK